MTTEQVIEKRSRIAFIAETLGDDELSVLELVAHGLARGRPVYGEMRVAQDPRDFCAEASAELRDAIVYIAAELLRLQRRGAP